MKEITSNAFKKIFFHFYERLILVGKIVADVHYVAAGTLYNKKTKILARLSGVLQKACDGLIIQKSYKKVTYDSKLRKMLNVNKSMNSH